MAKISFQDFSAYYKLKKKKYVLSLNKITLEIPSESFFVVVGPSGSGKTTLLKAILGGVELTDGLLIINGTSVENIKKKEANISYLSQEYSLYPHMTVYENVAFPLRRMRTDFQEIDLRVKTVLDYLKIDFLASRKPRQLSYGQMQRVAIARALVKNPRIMLFDEPFSNLEPTLKNELRLTLKNIHQEFKPTIIYATHDLTDAFILGEKIAVLNGGELEAIGTKEEIENSDKAFVRSFLSR
jgi:multiple sugar transport system ATP-binding protein